MSDETGGVFVRVVTRPKSFLPPGSLLDAVRVALGGRAMASVTPRTVSQNAAGLEILLAEDNPVNQKLAVRCNPDGCANVRNGWN